MSSGRGARRILELVEWMADRPGGTSLVEASTALGAPKSSMLGLLRLLVETGYAETDAGRVYRLVRLPGEGATGRAAYGTLLRRTADAVRRAVRRSQETGFVAVLAEGRVVYLDKTLPDREIRYDRDIEIPRQPFQVSSGLVLLSGLDEGGLTEAALQGEADGLGDRDELAERVRRAREDGHAVTRRGVVEGAAGVAAPIADGQGRVVAALNLAGPAERFARSLDEIVEITREAAEEASAALAWRR